MWSGVFFHMSETPGIVYVQLVHCIQITGILPKKASNGYKKVYLCVLVFRFVLSTRRLAPGLDISMTLVLTHALGVQEIEVSCRLRTL